MSKNIPIQLSEDATSPVDKEAEQHVSDMMGPAWSGSSLQSDEIPQVAPESSPAADTPVAPVEEEVPATTPQGTGLVEQPSEPALPTESDLNLADLPSAEETPETDERAVGDVVNEIIAGGTPDTPTEAAPQATDTAVEPVVMKSSAKDRFKAAFYRWWDNKVARYVTLGIIVVLIGVVTAVPVIRTGLMNLLGFRASISVYAVDATTLQPIKGATLKVGDGTVKTAEDGKAKLTDVRLGKQTVTVHKAGFADVKEDITFSFRAVDLGEVDMKATGLQLGFKLTDYLSGKPIEGVTLESGESSTKSGKDGKAVITLASDSTADTITIHKNGYRSEQVPAKGEENSVQTVKLVLAAKEIYVAKENGIYNLKKIDLDGKNDAVLLAGTGTETSAIDVAVDSLSQYAALISTRDNVKNKDGYLLSALTLVNISNGDSETIEHAEKLTIVGWSGTTLVYKQVVAGTSAANASREKIMAYNYATNKRYQLANANHFLGAELHAGTVYFAVSSTDPAAKSGLMNASLDGSAKKLIQEGDTWAAYRVDYKTMKLQTATKWYAYTFGGVSTETQPATSISRTYIDSGDAKLSIWSDTSATSGNLSLYNIADGKDQVLTKTKGQYKPLRWLNNRVLMYREATKTGSTDYVLSLDGGDAVKVTDTYSF